MQEPDPATIRAAIDGDVGAFEALVRAYQTHVWRFLRHLLGDPSLAEDVTQETFLRLHQRLATYRFEAKFSTWVFRVARNAGIDALRARGRAARLLEALAATAAPRVTADPSGRLEVAEALTSLSTKLRETVVLVEVFGLTHAEAGQVLGVPQGTVKSRLFRAREQLSAWLEDTERHGRGEVAGGA